jgi:hypothetical protein
MPRALTWGSTYLHQLPNPVAISVLLSIPHPAFSSCFSYEHTPIAIEASDCATIGLNGPPALCQRPVVLTPSSNIEPTVVPPRAELKQFGAVPEHVPHQSLPLLQYPPPSCHPHVWKEPVLPLQTGFPSPELSLVLSWVPMLTDKLHVVECTYGPLCLGSVGTKKFLIEGHTLSTLSVPPFNQTHPLRSPHDLLAHTAYMEQLY